MAEGAGEDEKTEEPTQKKLDDARKKGDVVKSQEVNSWFIILAATLFIIMFSKPMAASLAHTLKYFLAESYNLPVDGSSLPHLFMSLGKTLLAILSVPFLLMVIAGISGNLFQHGVLFSLKPVTPKLSKISPKSGFKRLFSTTSVVNFLKSIVKLVIVGAIISLILWPDRETLEALIRLDLAALLPLTHTISSKVLIGVLSVLTIVAAIDYGFQRQTWWKKQRMTVQELRDEYKQLEGDQQVRARLRQIRSERGRKRMMAAVPEATMVITNPTHYSIALKYETGMTAPVCLAKGVDLVALKIREVAEAHDIPLIENKPLARALHASVEIDDEIPIEHYKAVAEIIGYVMQLKKRRSA